jgi:histidine triad (HIT) family protein
VLHRRDAEVLRCRPKALAFTPFAPVTAGHVPVVPTVHVRDAGENPLIAAAMAAEAGPCNIITSVGREAPQSVFHLHLHVVPRRRGDGLALL